MVPEEQACGFWVPLTLTSKLAPPIQGTVGRLCALWRAESSKRQERLMFTDISGCHSSGGDAPGLEWGKPGILLNSLLCPHPHDPEWPQRLQRHDPYFSTLWRPPVRGGMRSPPKKRHLMLPPLGLGKPSQAVVPEKPTLYRQHHGDLCQTQ